MRRILNAAAKAAAGLVFCAAALFPAMAAAPETAAPSVVVLRTWYKLSLELVRHTPTYTPPVASRAFAYLGVAAYEAVASGSPGLRSLAGQLNGLEALPQREAGLEYAPAIMLDAALAATMRSLFDNTGPTGQRAMDSVAAKLGAKAAAGVPADVAARSRDHGAAIAAHVAAWAAGDGGAVVENMGFPLDYALAPGAAHWLPTSLIAQQQKPLLPQWGRNRTFAMPAGTTCPLPPPPVYSEDESSDFYRQAREVYDASRTLTAKQREIARFWADDAMLSTTPPGHWIAIILQILEREGAGSERSVDILARAGIAAGDAFIGCWGTKYRYDLVRPVTYIRRVIDPQWEPLLFTPPFPEYPSGHSTQSAAFAVVLTRFFGESFSFQDDALAPDGFSPRTFSSFAEAADDAAVSRLYGGIHFRAAIQRGSEQGRCIGAFAAALRTRR